MLDSAPTLGQKIRQLRKSRGMTQRELAGDRMTRNMLSMIENGEASPSVSSLSYISARLGVPAGFFIPRDREEEEKLFRLTFIGELRSAFARKDWKKCLEICPEPEDDEEAYIIATAHLRSAIEAADRFELSDANGELLLAEQASRKSVYCGESFSRAIAYYRRMLDALIDDDIPAELCDPSGCGEELPFAVPAYFMSLRALRAGEENSVVFDQTEHHRTHIKALELSLDEERTESLRLLRSLADDGDLPCYMRYRVLCDLERTADLCGNVRLAYSTSRRKLELIDKCRAK